MIEIILILGFIILGTIIGCVAYIGGYKKGLDHGFDDFVEITKSTIEAIQGDRADLEALSCDRKCGKRRTPNEHCENQLRAVGLEAVQVALDESESDHVQAVLAENVEAAESVKNPRHESTKKALRGSIGILDAAEFGERIGLYDHELV